MTAVGVRRVPRVFLQAFLIFVAIAWLIPMVTALYSSFRYFEADSNINGVFSLPETLTLDNYREAWEVGGIWGHLGKTMFIVIPALLLILFLSSMVAFACTRYSWRFNVAFLVLFTAGNLMPQQVIFQPLFQMFKKMPWPDLLSDTNTGNLVGTKVGVILIHVAFQTGFCTFVLSNYMKTIPKELGEAALVDGASVPRQYFQIVLPLCRPAFAALATLEFTWLYNDFFWGAVLLPQGAERPITSSIAVLNGQYSSDYNLIAAASMMIALPTLAVYLALQKQFISGLTLGANKG
ncbi:MAG: carbohydrate ABC transporter permease [Actinomycetota bacterium]|jgi:multiple sugar transport system permease protein|nr:MAG: multiple sugar transport system permease protein [Acidimicrobiaceae bacterium]